MPQLSTHAHIENKLQVAWHGKTLRAIWIVVSQKNLFIQANVDTEVLRRPTEFVSYTV